jgi:hypothetical protein
MISNPMSTTSILKKRAAACCVVQPPVNPEVYFGFMVIILGRTSSAFGKTRFNTPFSNSALVLSTSTGAGSEIEREKDP